MFNFKQIATMLAVASIMAAPTAFAASADKYQVTGKVLEISDTMIVVEKEGNRWEINRDANTEAGRAIKVGDKVTVFYKMTATEIEEKDATK